MKKSKLVDRVHRTMQDWGEPITVSDILKCIDIEETDKSRHNILCAISLLKKEHGVPIQATTTGKRRGRTYQIIKQDQEARRPSANDDQIFDQLAESARQKEIAENKYMKPTPLIQELSTKDLRAYEDLCYHYIRSRNGLTSSIQVADYYELTNEEGSCLLNRVAKRFSDVKLTIHARV